MEWVTYTPDGRMLDVVRDRAAEPDVWVATCNGHRAVGESAFEAIIRALDAEEPAMRLEDEPRIEAWAGRQARSLEMQCLEAAVVTLS